jgi:DNA-binding HxlR family transcriptional regulator
MRSYGQFCGVAKALDIVGDRWTLLIVRELLIRGPARYTDLQKGLPDIASNLLADRLRSLEAAGVLARREPVPPVATALFSLTDRGQQLRPVLQALGAWAGPLLAKPAPRDRFRSHWLAMPLEHLLTDRAPSRPPVQVEVRSGDESVILETVDGAVRVRPGSAENPTAIMTGSPELIIGLLAGRIDLATARSRRLLFEGDPSVLQRIGPAAAKTPSPPRSRRRRGAA